MKHHADIEDVTLSTDALIEDLLADFDDSVVDQEVELPEVRELTQHYHWIRAWGPPKRLMRT